MTTIYQALHGGSAFEKAYLRMKKDILEIPFTYTGEWQSQLRPEAANTREMIGVTFEYWIPADIQTLQTEVMPNLPWAEDHFLERVSGTPYNPPPSEAWWPFRVRGNEDHKDDQKKFSHTYPERFWPPRDLKGIRFLYGDLTDVVRTLAIHPETRQAYLPIFFPEDTGLAVRRHERVPCTLGYHFMYRQGRLHCWYFIRSCDLIRHFPDDVYMASRLTQYICDKLSTIRNEVIEPGQLTMVIPSLHTFRVDDFSIKKELEL